MVDLEKTMLPQRLRTLRAESGFAKTDLCEKLGITIQRYNTYEAEERFIKPPYWVLSKLADIYDTTVDYLIGRTNIREAKEIESLYNAAGLDHRFVNNLVNLNQPEKTKNRKLTSVDTLKLLANQEADESGLLELLREYLSMSANPEMEVRISPKGDVLCLPKMMQENTGLVALDADELLESALLMKITQKLKELRKTRLDKRKTRKE